MNLGHWISAFRLRTLFLSLSCIAAGLTCAHLEGPVDAAVAWFTTLTALFLQVLSNLANDYGDSVHGADHSGRKGPLRAVQAGRITPSQMKTAVIVFSILSLLSGIALLYLAKAYIGSKGVGILFLCGIMAIVAAIAYTNGKRPYGYMGLGDVSVFIFFGLVAVMGSYYLQTGDFINTHSIFPAVAYGLLSVGVLNLNNMRDIESDRVAAKNSIPVRLGIKRAKAYHYALLAGAALCLSIFTVKAQINLMVLLPLCLILFFNARAVYNVKESTAFDPLLKFLSLSTFGLTLLLYLSSLI